MASHKFVVSKVSNDTICLEKVSVIDYNEEADCAFQDKMGKKIFPPSIWCDLFEKEVATRLEKEAFNPTDPWVVKKGLTSYESRMSVYSRANDIKGGKLGGWQPIDGENNFTPPASNFEDTPTGYIRHYAHFHTKDWPWLSDADRQLLIDHISGNILSDHSKIFAVSKKYVSVGILVSKIKVQVSYWVRPGKQHEN
jgi:hypothetical protein